MRRIAVASGVAVLLAVGATVAAVLAYQPLTGGHVQASDQRLFIRETTEDDTRRYEFLWRPSAAFCTLFGDPQRWAPLAVTLTGLPEARDELVTCTQCARRSLPRLVWTLRRTQRPCHRSPQQ